MIEERSGSPYLTALDSPDTAPVLGIFKIQHVE
jgi:hypothetical protein